MDRSHRLTRSLHATKPAPSAGEISVSLALFMVVLYPTVQALLTPVMLLSAKRASQIQGMDFTTDQIIAATHPLAMLLGLLLALLLVGWCYIGSRNVDTFVRSLLREFHSTPFKTNLAAAVIGALIPVGYLAVLALLAKGAASRPPNDILGGAPGVACWIVSVVVLAPVAEEMLFRGILFRALSRRFGPTTFVVASTIAFTAVHLISIAEDWRAAISICVQGLIASAMFVRWRRLAPCVTLHVAYNTVVVLWVIAPR